MNKVYSVLFSFQINEIRQAKKLEFFFNQARFYGAKIVQGMNNTKYFPFELLHSTLAQIFYIPYSKNLPLTLKPLYPLTNNTNPTISIELSLGWGVYHYQFYDLYATFAPKFFVLSLFFGMDGCFMCSKTMANGTTSFRFATICRHFGIVNELLLLLCVFC